jgi:hypothetical protein
MTILVIEYVPDTDLAAAAACVIAVPQTTAVWRDAMIIDAVSIMDEQR